MCPVPLLLPGRNPWLHMHVLALCYGWPCFACRCVEMLEAFDKSMLASLDLAKATTWTPADRDQWMQVRTKAYDTATNHAKEQPQAKTQTKALQKRPERLRAGVQASGTLTRVARASHQSCVHLLTGHQRLVSRRHTRQQYRSTHGRTQPRSRGPGCCRRTRWTQLVNRARCTA